MPPHPVYTGRRRDVDKAPPPELTSLHTPPLKQGTNVCKRPRVTKATYLEMIHLHTGVITSKDLSQPGLPHGHPSYSGLRLRRRSDPQDCRADVRTQQTTGPRPLGAKKVIQQLRHGALWTDSRP